jgi:hypothetical protein
VQKKRCRLARHYTVHSRSDSVAGACRLFCWTCAWEHDDRLSLSEIGTGPVQADRAMTTLVHSE